MVSFNKTMGLLDENALKILKILKNEEVRYTQ